MDFKKRRIRIKLNKTRQHFLAAKKAVPDTPETQINPEIRYQKQAKTVKTLTLLAALAIVIALCYLVFKLISGLDFSGLIFSFGKDPKTDNKGMSNFLLVGKGGEGHDGSNLTDTIILASLDRGKGLVKMLSIPRDFYIKDAETGEQRINKIYDTYLNAYNKKAASEKLKTIIGELTGVEVHYIVIVDFAGFVKIIDSIGGIDIDVEEAIYDPYFPKGESIRYETFAIKAGPQHLDGETALKFARSRKTTSDFDRAKRQQQILAAVKDKALSLNILTNPTRIKALYDSLNDSVETDVSVAELIELAKTAKEINRDQIFSQVLSDDFTSCGGLLYTPGREYFGGASVLLPADNGNKLIKRFSNHYFFTSLIEEKSEVQVLNGTKTPGLAGTYLDILSRECVNTVYYGNALDREMDKSVIFYKLRPDQKKPAALEVIQKLINAPAIEGIPAEYLEGEKRANSEIVVILGADYYKIALADPFDSLQFLATQKAKDTETIEETPEKPIGSLKSSSASGSDTTTSDKTNSGNTDTTDTIVEEANTDTNAPTTTGNPISNTPDTAIDTATTSANQ